MSRAPYDVVIVGAGPAGLMAARRLAEHGFRALALEEHAAIGYPIHCTGLIGLAAFDELDLPKETILSVARSASFHTADGQQVVLESTRVDAAIIDRGAFDEALARRAGAAGVDIRTGVRVHTIETGARGVECHTSAGERPVAARACVLACGANYRLHRQLGLGLPRMWLQSAQIETPFPPRPRVEVHLGRELAPGGFAWLVPFRRGDASFARVGLMCETHARSRFAAFSSLVARRAGLDAASLPPARYKILPLGPVRKTFAARVLAVGDAAGLVKPTTGGGIYYSLLAGRLAGDVLQEALCRDALGDQDLRVYETRWNRLLGADIRTGLAFRALAGRLNDRAIETLMDLTRTDGVLPHLKEEANFNWHRGAVLGLLRNASFRRVVLSSLVS